MWWNYSIRLKFNEKISVYSKRLSVCVSKLYYFGNNLEDLCKKKIFEKIKSWDVQYASIKYFRFAAILP